MGKINLISKECQDEKVDEVDSSFLHTLKLTFNSSYINKTQQTSDE